MGNDTDILVVGSGIAGLAFAIEIAERLPDRHVTVMTKAEPGEANTRYAQGGIAVMVDRLADSFQQHVEDTLRAGDGLCDRDVVEMVVREAPERLAQLMAWGAHFDASPGGGFDLGREGGHSASRVLHFKDATGFEIERALLDRIRRSETIALRPHHFALDLIVDRISDPSAPVCRGARVLDVERGVELHVAAAVTMLASGGAGQIYRTTTNPSVATGDGIAMADRAGARTDDMEFVQFHPTALHHAAENPAFLISEAVRGAGAILRTLDGVAFMRDYDPRGELASRDIVARAIDREMRRTGTSHLLLDCRPIAPEYFRTHFPTILQRCRSLGIDPLTEPIPVVPAAHYICGGIAVDRDGRTTIGNLFAAGECARTGLHGANRLASNSLLEGIVYAHRSAESIAAAPPPSARRRLPVDLHRGAMPVPRDRVAKLRARLQATMTEDVGIVRTDDGLHRAAGVVENLIGEMDVLFDACVLDRELAELRNMAAVARLVTVQAARRRENRGGHYNESLSSAITRPTPVS